MIPDRAEEWGCPWIPRTKIVSEWREHGNEAVVLMCQGKNTEFVDLLDQFLAPEDGPRRRGRHLSKRDAMGV